MFQFHSSGRDRIDKRDENSKNEAHTQTHRVSIKSSCNYTQRIGRSLIMGDSSAKLAALRKKCWGRCQTPNARPETRTESVHFGGWRYGLQLRTFVSLRASRCFLIFSLSSSMSFLVCRGGRKAQSGDKKQTRQPRCLKRERSKREHTLTHAAK